MFITGKEIEEARKAAGWRENYAMDHGGAEVVYIRGHKCLKFIYAVYKEYQDANGATYDTITKQWIN